jgi:AAA+ ATPase superfamily predicted ATPase
MKFYNREKEIERLHSIQKQSTENAQFIVVTGRRRIGKTQLLLKATNQQPTLYFFVSRKAETFLCQDFQQEISEKLNIPLLGDSMSFGKLFLFLMQLSKERAFNLIIDEFQEFLNINPSIYNDMQHYWDVNKEQSRINLLICGSTHSLMHKIFKDYKAPLFGRATGFLRVQPFTTSVLKEILTEHRPNYTHEDLLALFTFTGGVAKYVQLFVDNKALTFKKMLDLMICEDSPFIADGKNMLIEEFGRDYGIYFTILSAIARGENNRGNIEAFIGKEIGGYITRLENDYNIIRKNTPLFAKSETKNVRYIIEDNFLTFWFRFIYKYNHIIEIAQFEELKKIIERDYQTFSGMILERYFRQKLIEQGDYTKMGGFWKKNGENEIDLIALNETTKTAQIIEIKRNKQHIRYNVLKEKTDIMINITGKLNDYTIEYLGLTMEDM